jgi:methyltransferase (TIGR00027 family)
MNTGWLGNRGSVSRTSQTVALTRAGLMRPCTPAGDPDAQRRLCAGMAPTRARVRSSIVARTRFFDDQVLAALSAGIRQVVICGAGYDDRALRFRAEGVRFFELDHPATQADKARRLRAMGASRADVVLAKADFRSDDVAAVLARCGHDAGMPTLFGCEGLLIYLDRQVIARLLGGLRSRAASGSVLAASLATHPAGMDSAEVAALANGRRRAGGTEPWLTMLPAGDYLGMLADAGWQADRSIDPADLEPDVTRGRSLLVSAQPYLARRIRGR